METKEVAQRLQRRGPWSIPELESGPPTSATGWGLKEEPGGGNPAEPPLPRLRAPLLAPPLAAPSWVVEIQPQPGPPPTAPLPDPDPART